MSEMNARIQQFLDANTNHFYFLLLKVRADEATNHPAEHGINLDVIMAARRHTTPD
jgi:hypothetical protein